MACAGLEFVIRPKSPKQLGSNVPPLPSVFELLFLLLWLCRRFRWSSDSHPQLQTSVSLVR